MNKSGKKNKKCKNNYLWVVHGF